MMELLRGLSEKELSDIESVASELLGRKADQLDKDVKAGRFTPEEIDLNYQEIFETYMATRREVESEQLRRKKKRIILSRIFSAVVVIFAAGMIYFLFFK